MLNRKFGTKWCGNVRIAITDSDCECVVFGLNWCESDWLCIYDEFSFDPDASDAGWSRHTTWIQRWPGEGEFNDLLSTERSLHEEREEWEREAREYAQRSVTSCP